MDCLALTGSNITIPVIIAAVLLLAGVVFVLTNKTLRSRRAGRLGGLAVLALIAGVGILPNVSAPSAQAAEACATGVVYKTPDLTPTVSTDAIVLDSSEDGLGGQTATLSLSLDELHSVAATGPVSISVNYPSWLAGATPAIAGAGWTLVSDTTVTASTKSSAHFASAAPTTVEADASAPSETAILTYTPTVGSDSSSSNLKITFTLSDGAVGPLAGAITIMILNASGGDADSTNNTIVIPVTVTAPKPSLPLPTATPSATPTATPTPSATPEPTVTPEPTATPTPDPTVAPEPTVTPEPTATPEPTPTPTPTPTVSPTYSTSLTSSASRVEGTFTDDAGSGVTLTASAHNTNDTATTADVGIRVAWPSFMQGATPLVAGTGWSIDSSQTTTTSILVKYTGGVAAGGDTSTLTVKVAVAGNQVTTATSAVTARAVVDGANAGDASSTPLSLFTYAPDLYSSISYRSSTIQPNSVDPDSSVRITVAFTEQYGNGAAGPVPITVTWPAWASAPADMSGTGWSLTSMDTGNHSAVYTYALNIPGYGSSNNLSFSVGALPDAVGPQSGHFVMQTGTAANGEDNPNDNYGSGSLQLAAAPVVDPCGRTLAAVSTDGPSAAGLSGISRRCA